MIIWLDHAIFGNGYGMRSPHWDNSFYWLVDTLRRKRNGKNGQLYTFSPGLGAQLHSYQWAHPLAGERRHLMGREFTVLHSSRRWSRVQIAWCISRMPADLDGAHASIRELKIDLDSSRMYPQ